MGFKPRLRLLLCIAMLMGISAFGATQAQSPRWLVLCALLVLLIAELCRRTILELEASARIPSEEMTQPIPADRRQQQDDLLRLEAQLEHAPVALFRIDQSPGAETVTPLNNYARRIIAPGRASDLSGLYANLLNQGERPRNIISFETDRGEERALVAVNTMTIQGKAQRMLALLPIESELESAALEAWQQLVRVLTHEIMNSLTPIASLSRTAHELLAEFRADLPSEASDDLSTALDAISRRAGSLVEFVASYRTLTAIAPAVPQRVNLQALFARLSALVTPVWQVKGGQVEFSIEPASLELMIDAGQLEQALINLLQNAAEATVDTDGRAASVHARLTRGGRLRIEVRDNGPGVPDALIPHIFTPFFSTKSRGGGIGLAMVRQLIHANGGTVRYVKSTSAGARFVVTI
jgi:signal transduction histidine kinase